MTHTYYVPSPAETIRAKRLQRDEDLRRHDYLKHLGGKDVKNNTVSKFEGKRRISTGATILLGALLGGIAGGILGKRVGYTREVNYNKSLLDKGFPSKWLNKPSGTSGLVAGAMLGAAGGLALGAAPELVGYIAGKLSNKSSEQLAQEYIQASNSGIKLPGTYTYLDTALNDRMDIDRNDMPGNPVRWPTVMY